MTYAIGQEVVYIGPDMKDHALIVAHNLKVPVPGAIYHIRSRREHPDSACGMTYFVQEIKNNYDFLPDLYVVGEPVAIPHHWLKPLEKRVTDISALRALLNPANHKHRDMVE
jgi:hypothetical protein